MPDSPVPRPRVSAIVLNRDGADHLRQLFQSMLPGVAAWLHEIIVIDHGSRDDSVAVCRSWSDRLPVRCVAFKRNHSFSWSNNRAAERASGDYLLLLNNDIRFEDNPLPAMLAAAQATGGAVGAGQQHVAPDGTPDGAPHIGVRLGWDPRVGALRPKEAAPGPCDEARLDALAAMPAVTASVLVVARETYLRLGGLNEGYDYGYEDIDFALTLLLEAGLPVTSLNGMRILHQEGGTRRRRARWARARRLTRNRRHFRERWAYPAWRWWRHAALADPGALLGQRLATAALRAPGTEAQVGLASRTNPDGGKGSVQETPKTCVVERPEHLWFDASEVPLVATVAYVRESDAATWCRSPQALRALDLVLATDPESARRLREAGAPAVATEADVAQRGLCACLADGARVGMVMSFLGGHGAKLKEVAGRLANEGHPVRIARSVAGLKGWADVFVQLGPRLSLYRPPGAPWLPFGPSDSLVRRVRSADATARKCPKDAALPDLSGADFPVG